MEYLARRFPQLVTLENVQDKFSMDTKALCGDKICRHYYMKLYNHRNENKRYLPQVFLSGELHGDEVVSPQALIELAEYLVVNKAYYDETFDTHYQQEDTSTPMEYPPSPWLSFLLETREIVIMPMTNPWGYYYHKREDGTVDVNRDFPFDLKGKQSACFQSETARAIDTIIRDNLFVSTITYHAGMMAISYDWGDTGRPLHAVAPDSYILSNVAKSMEKYAGPDGIYRYVVGTMNSVVYPVQGGMEEYLYAGSWYDQISSKKKIPEGCSNVQFTPPSGGTHRQLVFLVEATNKKIPAEKYLGVKQDTLLFNPEKPKQYIPMVIRTALSVIDLTYPYIYISTFQVPITPSTDTSFVSIPLYVYVDNPAFSKYTTPTNSRETDSTTTTEFTQYDIVPEDLMELYQEWTIYGYDIMNTQPYLISRPLSGSCIWSFPAFNPSNLGERPFFTDTIHVPNQFRDIYIVAVFKPDEEFIQTDPKADPAVPPQTHFANIRGNTSWHYENNNHIIQGRPYFMSLPVHIHINNVNIQDINTHSSSPLSDTPIKSIPPILTLNTSYPYNYNYLFNKAYSFIYSPSSTVYHRVLHHLLHINRTKQIISVYSNISSKPSFIVFKFYAVCKKQLTYFGQLVPQTKQRSRSPILDAFKNN
ncbi:hypothetical protein WA158_002059 [Blastocystis sp. Blastoise]